MKKIVIFASGNGTNAQSIMDRFNRVDSVQISLVLSNNPQAFALERASKFGIPAMSFNRSAFAKGGTVETLLKAEVPDLLVLAGFLWKIPESLVQLFPNKIINIHPALLPNYGGKGMYGMNVHRTIIENNERESGITIHYVNENYDEGAIIKQATCSIDPTDTAEDLAAKIHELEQNHFAKTIEELLK
ncbi:phosphoribosylglycinamide formyltransferase [uncultured Nonlabens sp.]|uniref:phosphoribosylglycinamide formyltransferase n=1 Tax=uncultured Nonlabens sp. TaxID=859306 RepID=UPI00262FCD1D|nr:phosphoribosylglycinamide formyltransferase [uncultured Nonlabens sp.]